MSTGSPNGPTVYLIHFSEPLSGTANHYLGWAKDLPSRLRQHASGTGSRLMAAVTRSGIPWRVVRTWPGNWTLERQLKKKKDSAGLCPVCREARKRRKTLAARGRRARMQRLVRLDALEKSE